MRYMLLIYGAETDWTPDERAACMAESLGVCDRLAARGEFVDASPLQSVTTAATVRVRDGQTFVTDGPFAETTEQLGGYYVVDLPDLDAAIAVAAQLPPAHKGTVEIRPLAPLDGVPDPRPVTAAPTGGPLAPYLLLVYDREAAWAAAGPDVLRAARQDAVALTRELNANGRFLSASPLHPAATATCVRVRDGVRTITDGPFAETHEVLGGYYLILAASRDEAARVAARHTGVLAGGVEVRPLDDLSPARAALSAA